jgi:hypothetical protein
MSPDDIHRILASEARIAPSPAFAASVMRAIEQETRTLPPLAFPWRRALPGWLALLACLVAGGIGIAGDVTSVQALEASVTRVSAKASVLQLEWIALSGLVTMASLLLTSILMHQPPHSWECAATRR